MYNYLDSMKADILEAIADDYNLSDFASRDELADRLNDDLWINDHVTGNGSGSYTDDETAKQYVLENTELLIEMVHSFGVEPERFTYHFMRNDWNYFDVSIRCDLLGQAIELALDELGGPWSDADAELETVPA